MTGSNQSGVKHPDGTPKCGRPMPRPTKMSVSHKDSQDELKDQLDRYISENELNQSESRNKLIEVVLGISGHFTAQDLIRIVSDVHPQIGTATVYRNLPLLLGAGLIKETLTDDSGLKIYELASRDHHDHLICLDCNQIFEFHDESIERAQDRISKKLGFKPVRHKHVIFAHCEYKKKT